MFGKFKKRFANTLKSSSNNNNKTPPSVKIPAKDKQDIMASGNLFIANYNQPGTMIDAKTATYAVCEEITSPMGANLSGFKNTETAKKIINGRPAQYYDWEGIFNKIN